MRLILINGIPSWQDGGLTLPVMAGGQEDPFDAIFSISGEEEEITTADLSAFVGRTLLDINTGFFGIVRTRLDRNLGRVYWLSNPDTGRAQDLKTGATLVDPSTRQVTNVGASLTGSAADSTVTSGGKLSEADLRRILGISDPGPAGRAPPAFGSTQPGQTQAEAFAREQAAQAEAFAREQAAILAKAREDELRRAEEQREIDRELRLREARLTTARDLVNIRSAEAREARTQGTQLAGSDPFRFLAVARGLQPPTGTTPSAGFKQNLLGAAQFQAPDLTGLDSNALESVIGKLSQSITPTGSATLGFAHGGTLDRGGVLGGTRPGDGTVAIDVGEPINGMPNPEIVILRPDGSVEVVQKAGAAQTGGEFDFGGFPSLFSRLRQSVFPSAERPESDPNSQILRSRFGFLPRGVSAPQTGDNIPFQAFSGPVSRVFQGQKEALEFQFLAAGLPAAQATAQATTEARRIDALMGLLPAPFKIPPMFFQSLLPAEQTVLISAYRLAGTPEADFRHLLTAPQLSATPQRATAVG